jgi:hypothetical protein
MEYENEEPTVAEAEAALLITGAADEVVPDL